MSGRCRLTAIAVVMALGINGCVTTGDSTMSKQSVGTVLGAVGGALIGSQVGSGSGRNVAILAGAIAGGALGNMIGARLDERDRLALAARTQQALETGESVDWRSEHSGATATITPVSTTNVVGTSQVTRAPKIARVDNMTVINQPYRALKSANLRSGPDVGSEKVGGFALGQTFTALGRTDNDWIAVGRKGVTVGYVFGPLVGPVAVERRDEPTDLDAIPVNVAAQQGFDLDAIEPAAPVREQVVVQTTCRTVAYTVRTSDGEERETVKACQDVDGAWQLG